MAFVGFGNSFTSANQAAVLVMQLEDQRISQNLFAQHSARQARQQSPQSIHTPAPGQQMQMKMQMMMIMMMAMMQSMAQLSGGFSSFLGGSAQPQYPAPYAG